MEVVVVSPRRLLRKALCALLATVREVRVVSDLDSVVNYDQLARKLRAPILLIDVVNPVVDLEVCRQLRLDCPEARVLYILDHDDDDFQVRAMKEGAFGCISARSEPEALLHALEVLARDEVWIDPRAAARIISQLVRPGVAEEKNTTPLTRREQEILALVAAGFHNKEIANRLCVSDNTVKTHLLSIYRKLGVSGRMAAAIQYFHQSGAKAGAALPYPEEAPHTAEARAVAK